MMNDTCRSLIFLAAISLGVAAVLLTGAPSASAEPIEEAAPIDGADVPVLAEPHLSELVHSLTGVPLFPHRLVAGFQAEGDLPDDCMLRRSDDGGETWRTLSPLPRPAWLNTEECQSPLAMYARGGGRLHVAYTLGRAYSESRNVLFTTSEDGGMTWRTPRVVLRANRRYATQLLGIATPLRQRDATRVYILMSKVFGTATGSLTEILFTGSADRGRTWSTPIVVAEADERPPVYATISGPRIVGGPGGEVLVAWYSDLAGQRQIEVRRSGDYGATFGPAITALQAHVPNWGEGPEVRIGPAGIAHLVFRGFDPGGIGYIWSRPPYDTWSTPVPVNDGPAGSTVEEPSIAIQPCGTTSILHAIWSDSRETPPGNDEEHRVWNLYYARKIALPGEPWSASLRVSDVSSPGYGPSVNAIAATRDGAFAVWWQVPPQQIGREDALGSPISAGVSCP